MNINGLEASLNKKAEYEKLVLEVSSDMVNCGVASLDDGITSALEKIGQYCGTTRAFIYLLSEQEEGLKLKYEWESSDYLTGNRLSYELSLTQYPWFMEKLQLFEMVYIKDVATLPDDAAIEREALITANVRSIILFPIVYNNMFIGIIGFCFQKIKNIPDEDNINLFKISVSVIVNAVVRKIAEDSLMEQIRFQQDLIDAIPNPLYYKDTKGTYIACNKAFTEFIGIPLELIIGKDDYNISQKYLADLYSKSDKELIQNPGVQTYEGYIYRGDGTLHDVIFYKATLKDKDGKPYGIVGTFADISEQKWLEKKLKDQHERFIAVLEGLNFGVYVVDIETYEILFINKYLKDMVGPAVGSSCWRSLHKGFDGPCTFCPIGTLLAHNEEGQNVHVWEREENGKWWFLSDRLIRWVNGRLAKLQFAMDITHIKQMEAALRESEELFKTLAENSFTGVGLYREHFIYVNPEMERIFAISEDGLKNLDMTNKTIFDVFSIDSNIAHREATETKECNIGTSCTIETKGIRVKDGTEKWTRIYSTIVDYKGLPTNLINIIDVTDRIQYEQKLQEQKNELEQLNKKLEALNKNLAIDIKHEVEKSRQQEQLMIQQSKMASMGEMLGSIAHQWRQPLNALGLIIQDLQDAYEFGEIDSDYVNKVVNESMELISFMSKTIDDFRNFFIPTKEKKIFNVIESLNEVLLIVSAQLKNSFIEIEERYKDKKPIEVTGYPNEFKQVILNIISNARDALIERKKRDIIANGVIFIDVEEVDDVVKIMVGDNGGGVPSDVLPYVFDAYFTTKKDSDGTGIGLYMSKVIIENNMGGKLYAENIQDGALFTIILKNT
ncbi:MAG: PAS domain S-box protein [Candidatus Magnetoovum sp. WYHC-5]|nr:PAS domain S-box protein [Candidatus Magnetoovum sp. WYHC-5]